MVRTHNQQLLAMYIQTEYTWYTTPKYQYWFRAILGRFPPPPQKKMRLNFHSNLGFFEFFSFQSPLVLYCNFVYIVTET